MAFGEYAIHGIEAENQAEIAGAYLEQLERIATALEGRVPVAEQAVEAELRKLGEKDRAVRICLRGGPFPHAHPSDPTVIEGRIVGVEPGLVILREQVSHARREDDGIASEPEPGRRYVRISAIEHFEEHRPSRPGGRSV